MEYVNRNLKKHFEKVKHIYPIIALVGARQSGKTTFLKEQLKKTNSSYLLFDDPDIKFLFEEDIKKFESQFLEGKEISVLDEIHYCKTAGQKLKYLADVGRKLWITSSSEIILSKKILSFLVGRVGILKLYPFSFEEFLDAKNQKFFSELVLKREMEEHILYGGYPKVVLTKDNEIKKDILLNLYNTMVLKDVAQTFSIKDIKKLEDFSKYLSLNISNLISYDTISSDLNLSFQSVKKYLDAMEKSHLLIRVLPYFKNKQKELTKQPKLYFLDTGLRNIIAKDFEIGGDLFENYVFSELLKMGYLPKYWRTKSKSEVDFIIEKDSKIIPIEVKLTCPNKISYSLKSFIDEYSPKNSFIVFLNGKKKRKEINNSVVNFVDLVELKKFLKKL